MGDGSGLENRRGASPWGLVAWLPCALPPFPHMVAVAQLAERLVVAQKAASSSLASHPFGNGR